MDQPQVTLVGPLHDGDPLDYLLAGDARTERLADAHAIFQRTVKALKQTGYDLSEIDRYTREALGVTSYAATAGPDYPRLLRENYERLVRATDKWVQIR